MRETYILNLGYQSHRNKLEMKKSQTQRLLKETKRTKSSVVCHVLPRGRDALVARQLSEILS